MSKPVVMILHPQLRLLAGMLAGDYTVLTAWETAEADTLAQVGAVIAAGEFALDKPLLERMPKLGLIACFSAGYDGIDVGWARARGLAVTHAPGVNAEDVADHAIGMMLALRRRIFEGDALVRAGGWDTATNRLSRSLAGQVAGVVGLGRIGVAVARRCAVLRMEVRWWGPRAKPDAEYPRAESLLTLAAHSDVLVLAAPGDAANRGMISAEVIAALGSDGLLVNVGRGQLVDEDALLAALRAGMLGGAALDVFADEPTPAARWAGVTNTVLTPHTAGATDAAVRAMVGLLLANLDAFFEGGALVTPVA